MPRRPVTRRTRGIAGAILAVLLVATVAVVATRWASARTASTAASGRAAASGSSAADAVPRAAEQQRQDGAQDWAAAVRAENAQPGSTAWRIGSTAGKTPGLEAYADRVSVRPGEPVGLYVRGKGTVVVRAFRIGDYGGRIGRLVWSGSLTATTQPAARFDESPIADAGGIRRTHLVVAPWRRSALVATSGWPEGDYLFRLDAGPAAQYVPLTVRSATARGRVLVVVGAMTWQAYNAWGRGSLYDGEDGDFADRSLAVSFDRPYQDGYGSGKFLTYDSPVLTLAERAGLPLAWATDYDVATDPSLLDGATAVVLGGHLEYWTGPMRDAVAHAVSKGSNLAVFGANTAYWRVRLAGRTSALPGAPDRRDGRPRVIVGTKNPSLDPLASRDPGGATARFRDGPGARPEEGLTGMRYDCYPAETSWTVVDPTWWGYAGTGVRAGERLDGVVGPEADRLFPVGGRPSPAEIVAYQPYSCGPRARTVHTGLYWVAPSGAGVFNAGTMRWECATEVGCTGVPGKRSAAVLSKVTTTVLTAFAQPLAGRTHPARDNVAGFALSKRATTNAA